MQQIFEKAKADYTFIDEQAGVCCGRPLALSGNWKAAQVIMDKNLQMIDASQANILVTSCPICYKTFKEDYLLNIKIMHHTEYINMLIQEGQLKVNALDLKTVFHNPCELGRQPMTGRNHSVAGVAWQIRPLIPRKKRKLVVIP